MKRQSRSSTREEFKEALTNTTNRLKKAFSIKSSKSNASISSSENNKSTSMAALPKSYKAAVVSTAGGPFELVDVELKHPSDRQVLVKVKACGVCYSDVAAARGEFGPHLFPRVFGHEIVGDIVEVGSAVPNLKIGDRVGGPWHGGHDGTCRQCQRSQFQMCEAGAINGITQDGGFAEYVLLRAEAVVRIPKELDPAQAAPLLCAGVTVFNGIRKQKIEHGAIVAVQGLGGLGHLAVQYARRMGYEVVALSHGSDKESFAKQLGAHHYINTSTQDVAEELTKLGGANLIVQTAPNPTVVGKLAGGLAPSGKVLSLAPVGPVEVDTITFLMKNLSFTGWPSGHAIDSEEAIKFAINQDVKAIVEKFPLKDVQKAVDSVTAGKSRFRNVLVME